MSHHHLDFVNKSDWYRGELAYAKQQRMIKEARREGLAIPSLISVRSLAAAVPAAFTATLAVALNRVSGWMAGWRHLQGARLAPVPSSDPLENQASPCP